MGFGTHPHDNMEIITIPLSGDLAHKDSMGNGAIIRHGDIQVMSAGTGIEHSEYNANSDIPTELLQIWLFPKTQNVTPRYEQKTMNIDLMQNKLFPVLTPNPTEDAVWIHQDAWFYMSHLDMENSVKHTIHQDGQGVFIFVLEGEVNVNGETLKRRDAIGFWETESFEIKASKDSKLLLMEFPMDLPSYF